MSVTTLADWITLAAMVAVYWSLSWELWRRTRGWEPLDAAISLLILMTALFWTWATLARPAPWLRHELVVWGFRVGLTAAGVWALVELRRLPRGRR